MPSTMSYMKHILAFQKGLQTQPHNVSTWKQQQLHMHMVAYGSEVGLSFSVVRYYLIFQIGYAALLLEN